MYKVYLVGTKGPEHYNVIAIFTNRKVARRAWDEIRKKLIEQNEEMLEDTALDHMYEEMIESLQEEDPEEMNNYPHSTPFINERSVLEEFDSNIIGERIFRQLMC